jgi:nucleotide-binding universal stress UspA family protein
METTTMASIRTVVVATDFSRTSVAAVERGAHLAVQLGARLCLLHALDEAARKAGRRWRRPPLPWPGAWPSR